jgi:hypothetical protein
MSYLCISDIRFLSANYALPSSIVDDLVNISLPIENVFPERS